MLGLVPFFADEQTVVLPHPNGLFRGQGRRLVDHRRVVAVVAWTMTNAHDGPAGLGMLGRMLSKIRLSSVRVVRVFRVKC